MLGRHRCAGDVESIFTARFRVFSSEAVSKLQAVVGQDLADFDGVSELEPTQKIDAARLSHAAVDVD